MTRRLGEGTAVVAILLVLGAFLFIGVRLVADSYRVDVEKHPNHIRPEPLYRVVEVPLCEMYPVPCGP